ncbi:MAG: molybdopterin dinucleotide binding domain-containing protein [Methanobacteriaceae archaeon]
MLVNLITGRTVWQGQAIESGKDLEMYINAAAIAHINDDMLAQLGIKPGQNIKIIAPHGEVVVKAVATKETLPEDSIYVPMGPWANRVVDPTTNSTAMPSFKNVPVEIIPTDEEVLDMPTLMKVYGKV